MELWWTVESLIQKIIYVTGSCAEPAKCLSGFYLTCARRCAPEFLTIKKKNSCMRCIFCISVVCVKHLCWEFDSNSPRMYCMHGWNAMLMTCVTIASVTLRSFLLSCLIYLFVCLFGVQDSFLLGFVLCLTCSQWRLTLELE